MEQAVWNGSGVPTRGLRPSTQVETTSAAQTARLHTQNLQVIMLETESCRAWRQIPEAEFSLREVTMNGEHGETRP